MIPKMFHVKHFRPVDGQNLTTPKHLSRLPKVRSGNVLVQWESGGQGVMKTQPIAGTQSKCKIGAKARTSIG
jgi:hypothetical protein